MYQKREKEVYIEQSRIPCSPHLERFMLFGGYNHCYELILGILPRCKTENGRWRVLNYRFEFGEVNIVPLFSDEVEVFREVRCKNA